MGHRRRSRRNRDCSYCCCNTASKKCYQYVIIFISIFILSFQIIIIVFAENRIKPEEVENFILSERPLFDFELNSNVVGGKKNITFFEFKGRKKKEGNKTITYDKKSFNYILGNKFLYNGYDRNYFDYKNDYSTTSGQNCPSNLKPCGIMDSSNRILCLPANEECPLNGFAISKSNQNEKYPTPTYTHKELHDSLDYNNIYHIYYTNSNTGGKIITEFKLSYGKPCAKITENHWIPYYNNEIEDQYDCQTSINGDRYSKVYQQVPENDGGIKIKSLYHDNGLTSPSTSTENENEEVQLYIRNFNEIDEKCLEKFLKDLEDEKKYYDSVFPAIRGLIAVSSALIVGLFIYMIASCCCELTYNFLAVIVPIYGIISNIIVIGVVNRAQSKYQCQLEGFNEEIDEFVENHFNNKALPILMSAFSIAFYIFVLILNLCLKFMRPKNIGIIPSSGLATPVPIYPQAYPVNYGPNAFYQNMMQSPGSYGFNPQAPGVTAKQPM